MRSSWRELFIQKYKRRYDVFAKNSLDKPNTCATMSTALRIWIRVLGVFFEVWSQNVVIVNFSSGPSRNKVSSHCNKHLRVDKKLLLFVKEPEPKMLALGVGEKI